MSKKPQKLKADGQILKKEFEVELSPVEGGTLLLLTDNRTGAKYCECHVKASKLIELGTVDVPLDPDDQSDYRANREVVEDAYAFQKMKEDAKLKRSFSSIVAEYTKEFDEEHPVKIIGGQHRFEAIKEALAAGVDELQGLKVYFDLDMEQRLDVQLISNTNIETSSDLFDRMHETVAGPELRNWCQKTGLLNKEIDFADRRARGGPLSVQMARTFIMNYFRGLKLAGQKSLDDFETTPHLSVSGRLDPEWEKLKSENPKIWEDKGLTKAGTEFAKLVKNQRASFDSTKAKAPLDYPEKAMNMAVLSAWAFVVGTLQKNPTRLSRHFALADSKGKDPLNAKALASGKHKSDSENYRGLGYRTDAKERGRFFELFSLQAEDGKGISSNSVDAAIKKYHAKQANLEYLKAKKKGP